MKKKDTIPSQSTKHQKYQEVSKSEMKPRRKVKMQKRTTAPSSQSPLPWSDTPLSAPTATITVAVDALAELESRVKDLRESWETDSLFKDILVDDLTPVESDFDSHKATCTPEEANLLRSQLRTLGPTEFCIRTVDCGRYTAKKLLTAFGIRPPAFLEGSPDEAYLSMLSLAFSRELDKRAKLSPFNTVDDAATLIANSKHIVCLTGAGISTSLGIPDFRSTGTGLYSKLEHLGLADPQEVFDINVFRESPYIFYTIAREILPSATGRYSPTHAFIAMLQERGKLLTNYSQNIDNLEAAAGIKPENLVQCHGSFATASCIDCHYRLDGELIFPDIRAGQIPICPRCAAKAKAKSASRVGSKPTASRPQRRNEPRASSAVNRRPGPRRSHGGEYGDDEADGDIDLDEYVNGASSPPAGVMKPDITFFGEPLPDEFSRRLTMRDRDLVDLVVVIGTSLKVTPVSEIVGWLPPHVPQICISREPVAHVNFDIDLLGDCDVVVAELCRRLGWPLHHDLAPPLELIRVQPQHGFSSRHVFTLANACPPHPLTTESAPRTTVDKKRKKRKPEKDCPKLDMNKKIGDTEWTAAR